LKDGKGVKSKCEERRNPMFQVSADCHRGQIERCTLYSSYNSTYPHVRKHPRRLVRDISPFSSPVLVSLVFRVSSFNSFFAPFFFPSSFSKVSLSLESYILTNFFFLKKRRKTTAFYQLIISINYRLFPTLLEVV
jgi:hypothetical protein